MTQYGLRFRRDGGSELTIPSGKLTFYYTNQQSGRLMFYHDHAAALTRLNVYAGMAPGYVIHEPVEDAFIANGTILTGRGPKVFPRPRKGLQLGHSVSHSG